MPPPPAPHAWAALAPLAAPGDGLTAPPDSPAFLNSLGFLVTVAAWLVLLGLNGWCLYKLMRPERLRRVPPSRSFRREAPPASDRESAAA